MTVILFPLGSTAAVHCDIAPERKILVRSAITSLFKIAHIYIQDVNILRWLGRGGAQLYVRGALENAGDELVKEYSSSTLG
jgi:hypothetical protein